MVGVAWKHASRLVQGSPKNDLWLRVVGTMRHGQVVRLAAPKCTIGSARGCTLRLRAAGVRAVDCIILRGLHGTVARSWSAATRLNGHNFSEAKLSPGDRLAIGPIELEVLDPETAATTAADSMAAAKSRRVDAARHRIKNLIATLRGLKAQVAELQARLNAASGEQIVRVESHVGDEQQAALERERRDWQASCSAIEAELEARDSRLAAEFSRLETQQAEWNAHKAAEESRLAELGQMPVAQEAVSPGQEAVSERQQLELDAKRAELEQRLAEAETLRCDLEQAREALDAERVKAASRMAREEQELENRQAELEAERVAFEAQRTAWRSLQPESPQPSNDLTPSAEAEHDDEDQQPNRFEQAASQQDSPGEPEDEEGEEETQPKQLQQAAAESRGEEESLEECMANFLSRYTRGGSSPVVAPEPPRAKRNDEPSPGARPRTVEPPKAPPPPKTPEAAVPAPRREGMAVGMPAAVELTRRVQRPETSDLAAMRELANTHARIAIDTHGSKRLLKVAAARFGTAAVCVAASAVLLHLTSYEYRASRTLIMAGFVASIYLLWQGSKAVQAMVKLLHAKKGTAAPPTEETEPSA